MIVCICNNISKDRIQLAVNAGMRSMSELRKELGVAACCGKCHTCARRILRECVGHTSQTRHPAQTLHHASSSIIVESSRHP